MTGEHRSDLPKKEGSTCFSKQEVCQELRANQTCRIGAYDQFLPVAGLIQTTV